MKKQHSVGGCCFLFYGLILYSKVLYTLQIEEEIPMATKQMIYDETMNQMRRYLKHFPEDRGRLDALMNQANEGTDLFSRKTLPGHITGSAIIMKQSDPNFVLMIFHQNLHKWLQPGGHVDPGEYPQNAAIRELNEETNMNGRLHSFHEGKLFPIDIDIHPIPANVNKQEAAHDHYDFRYLVIVDDETIGTNPEQNEVAWIPVKEITNRSLLQIIDKVKKMMTLEK